ncbi:MAG: hypothetical protein UT41_C0001G0059 [Candidatus Wolfebacteria bacterium GW2011_GWC2_39_22]|uniref:Uncharacterized protein n=1 Tax=Candidatus Wolfebacteria bacterium GW2011_GWC2_39_22 TaxID=1619013 RepID=A0A0G0QQ37_9BACT|nr:MAG: hypothetical protein UT41_C0001G0059 [Candidatus Wolfebacteria bacterium GW2011_GWC2_39_22]HBI25719.1 hypothetical protein [Candidatus Wolfebacteria bacterium]
MKIIRTRAAFSTALLAKTAIRPGDVIKHNIGGVYIWRQGDSYLETILGKQKYIFTNSDTMSIVQMQHSALEVANFIGLLTGMSVTEIDLHDGVTSYQLGDPHQ